MAAMGAKRKLARRAVKRTYGSRRSSSWAPTAIAKDILAAPIGRSSSRQEAATAKRGGAGGAPHNGASLRSRRAAPGPAEHKNSRPRQPRGFIGPLAVGWILDLGGGMAPATWAAAFLAVALLSVVALAVFTLMRPQELSGDRGSV